MTRPGTTPLKELVESRELLRNLTGRELKVRYKRSSLGFLWTLLNPLLMMGVFTLVLGTVFPTDIDRYPIYFLTGYLPFAFFQASVQNAAGCVVGNASLITKVYFPRAVLPLSVVASQLVHYLMASGVLLVALVVVGIEFWPFLPLWILGIVLLAAFAAGMAMLFAAANTFLRDIAEFLTVGFLLLFYATPIVYPRSIVDDKGFGWLLNLNPMTHYVTLLRDATYDPQLPGIATLAYCVVVSAVSLVVGYRVFVRLASRFPKEV